ncbi:hypothetical protein N7520_002876 [Penicillium odoratum]|uniref:uncharacterized protein n=1 Tax=Penicillium odoratum TaxID=1167516 RepID=UPI00254784BE|nr:uncharacterized protein N7520_002876 [Penicillium odoratum]KAJ5772347.1 hypothetical protein N7520_002876 [Penicillium odoratum]
MNRSLPSLIPIDVAACDVSAILNSQRIHHAFIGGYATGLIKGQSLMADLEVIVDCDPLEVCKLLVKFSRSRIVPYIDNHLFYRSAGVKITIDVLQSGGDDHTPLPDIRTSPLCSIPPTDALSHLMSAMPFLHPSVLILTNVSRWYKAKQFNGPLKTQAAAKYFENVIVILKWLDARRILINFAGFPQMSKDQHIATLRALNADSQVVGPLLIATLIPEDYRLILGNDEIFLVE